MIPGITLYGGKSRLKLNVNSVFKTALYTGNGGTQNIITDIDLLGEELTGVTEKFATTLYTGTGSTQTITNGIDLASEGGLVWAKCRNSSIDHYLFDTNRTATKWLRSSSTSAEGTAPDTLTSFNSDGFSLSSDSNGWVNISGRSYVAWTFKKAAKFFDIVTYTGNGVVGRQIPHGLGVAPGMIIVKRFDGTNNWTVHHRSVVIGNTLSLNRTDVASSSVNCFQATSDASFTLGGDANVNANTGQYVAYLFAHDPSPEGFIQCGSFSGNGSTTFINLGWVPQFLLLKNIKSQSNWLMLDTSRGFGQGLNANLTATEAAAYTLATTSTGFSVAQDGAGNWNKSGEDYIYIAIRAPEYGPDEGGLVWIKNRAAAFEHVLTDTARGTGRKLMTNSNREEVDEGVAEFLSNGYTVSTGVSAINASSTNYASWSFRKAPKFFDVVTYTGNSVLGRQIPHNLGVAPGMIIVKRLDGSADWQVYHRSASFPSPAGPRKLLLNSTAAEQNSALWENGPHTDTYFVTDGYQIDTSGNTYVAYLFAHDPTPEGIIQCGSISAAGAVTLGWEPQFVLFKNHIDSGDWFLLDAVRGNTYYLRANLASAEATSGTLFSITSNGFTVNQRCVYMAIRAPNI